MKVLGVYKNGNYTVSIFSNGTKIRRTDDDNDDELVPVFAENCDVKITDKCDGGCPFCYEGCTANGKHGDILNYKFLDTLHPYTELAINGNDLSHPDLVAFMLTMKEKKIILNMTVNQIHFEKNFNKIKQWIDDGLIYGLGVSLREPTDEFIDMISQIPNAVIHVINGIVSISELRRLSGRNLKVLVLGYKRLRRGENYYEENDYIVTELQADLSACLFPVIMKNGWFKVVSCDNLAIEQLHVKEHVPEKQWKKIYAGDDGTHTFYIDMVEGTFGKNSLATERYSIMDSIDDMFQKIVEQG